MAAFDHISLFEYLKDDKQVQALEKKKEIHVSSPEALAVLVGLSFLKKPRKMFFLFPTIHEAEIFSQFLGDYIQEEQSYIFPFDEIFRTSAIGVSPEMREERLLAISSIFSDKPSVLVSHISSSVLQIMPKERYQDSLIRIQKGDMENLTDLVKKISSLGYTPIDRVTAPFQFALRGGILDIYDPSNSYPVRIEFFGDEIDDIRLFRAEDELSFQHLEECVIHPSSLRMLSSEEIDQGIQRLDTLLKDLAKTDIDRLTYDELLQHITEMELKARRGFVEDVDARFFPLFSSKEASLLSYLDDYEKFVYLEEDCLSEYQNVYQKQNDYFLQTVEEHNSVSGERIYVSTPLALDTFVKANNKEKDCFILRENSFKSISYSQSDIMLQHYLNEGYKIRIFLPEPNYSNYLNYLSEREIPHSCYPEHSLLMLMEGRITRGFEIPERKHVYLSTKEIFGVNDTRSRFLSRYKESKIIRKYDDLQEGDYVVHEVHGVGRYLGIQVIDGLEYLKIQYAKDALFFVPLAQYKMIRKYSSRDGYTPTLDTFGGSTWSRKKSRIRAKISYLADQLLALYSERRNRPGYAFPPERELEQAFMDEFSYPYTDSQLQALKDVREDMEDKAPMDRLVAGDVGFGKTEIAFNAAFKAICAHKQAVLLCPTTILSMQHYKVALERFKDFGVRVGVLNRFLNKEQQKKVIEDIKTGDIDFVIGTHALLSDKITFKDLGLLIIDEEQKFGVTHKEKIKEKAKNIDCLTLTATPIPRTMQMSLLGVRSMSLLTTAPINRMPVKTYVAKQDDGLILEVIQKELNRKGQVYYLHNDIKSIYHLAEKLQKKLPDAKVGVVHAQMDKDAIEDIMDEFYQCEIDVLVCTSIIESGLDIPNVNTIIVENADHFGLAQLYQIKGRVGRSDRLAYAYFFFKDSLKLTDEAKKRLKALKDFTELGSGYKIAMQDLNIRGAGDILGSEQAGFVDSLGYEAYMELLNTVVKEKKLVKDALEDKPKPHFELSFSLDSHIPSQYGSESQRVTMYRELSDCQSDKDLQNFAKKLRDVYGPYSEEVANLIEKKKIEIHLNNGLYSRFSEGLGVYTITMSEMFSNKNGIFKTMSEKIEPLLVKLRVRVVNHCLELVLTKTRDYLQDLLLLTEKLDEAYHS